MIVMITISCIRERVRPIVIVLLTIVTDVSDKQTAKAIWPILVTLVGIVIDVSDVPAKAQ